MMFGRTVKRSELNMLSLALKQFSVIVIYVRLIFLGYRLVKRTLTEQLGLINSDFNERKFYVRKLVIS